MLSYFNPLPSLLEYTGPHKVGSVEYEISLRDLGLGALPDGLPISTIRFRVFYPTTAEVNTSRGVPWLPEPQTTYLGGYLKMARVNPWLSSILLSVPLFLRTTMMPAYDDAPLSYQGSPLPVLIFSHGLVGNMNTHSAILGELSSHGVFCVALEHRDGSAALSLIRAPDAEVNDEAPTEVSSMSFKRISLRIKPGVLEERDEQLKIRIFELTALYRALESLNKGMLRTNLASKSQKGLLVPESSLDLKPGSVIWAGHSFGGATIVQLVKSVYYANLKIPREAATPGASLLLQRAPPSLIAQITPVSPVILLDPWFMPLKSPRTEWLLRKPLPCHDANPVTRQRSPRNVVVMSMEFAWHWPECHAHMPAITSQNPANVKVQSQEEYEIEFKRYGSPRDLINRSKKARAASKSPHHTANKEGLSEDDGKSGSPSPIASFLLHDTTHVTHSDFGLLFRMITWWYTGQKAPALAVQNTVHCVLDAAGLQHGNEQRNDIAAQAQLERLS